MELSRATNATTINSTAHYRFIIVVVVYNITYIVYEIHPFMNFLNLD